MRRRRPKEGEALQKKKKKPISRVLTRQKEKEGKEKWRRRKAGERAEENEAGALLQA